MIDNDEKCNHCKVKDIREQAMSDENKFYKRLGKDGFNIYVMPPGVKMPNQIKTPTTEMVEGMAQILNGDEFHTKYWKGWFADIPSTCDCPTEIKINKVTISIDISIDGDHVCVLYGDNLQTGIAGFGLSIPEAFNDLALNWATEAKRRPEYNVDAFLKVD